MNGIAFVVARMLLVGYKLDMSCYWAGEAEVVAHPGYRMVSEMCSLIL